MTFDAKRLLRLAALPGVLLLAAYGVATASGSGASTQPVPARTASGYRKVMIIAEENKTYGQIIGSHQAPYLNRLATAYGSARAMDAGYPAACPSLAAYLLITSGDRYGICDDKGPRHHRVAGDNIFAQVAAAGRTWRVYGEDMPAPCARRNSADGVFLVRHTPAPYYLSEHDRCPGSDIPMGTPGKGALRDDVSTGNLPAYAFVTPNACHDMHTAHPCPGHGVPAGDAWLAQWVPQILAGPDFQAGRLVVIITWDEGSGSNNHIPTLVLSPTTRHRSPATPFTHCSTLATVEELLGLPRLGCAASTPTMTAAFHL